MGSYKGTAASNPHFRKYILAVYESRFKDTETLETRWSSEFYNPERTQERPNRVAARIARRQHGNRREVGVLQEVSGHTTAMDGFLLTPCTKIHSRQSEDLNIKITQKHEFMTT